MQKPVPELGRVLLYMVVLFIELLNFENDTYLETCDIIPEF
jgi:hypothetical protein